MGHVRLGTLPRSRPWRKVVDLIADGASAEEIARASADAADHALNAAAQDPGFGDGFWLLANLPLAARAPGWLENLHRLGLDVAAPPSLVELTDAITHALDRGAVARGGGSDLAEMARLALVEALTDHAAPQLPTLFAPDPAELRSAVGRLSSGDRFAELNRSFFAALTRRVLDGA